MSLTSWKNKNSSNLCCFYVGLNVTRKLVVLTLAIRSFHAKQIMDGSYEYQSNEDVEKTHVYTIFGLTTGIVAKDKNIYIFHKLYEGIRFTRGICL